MSRDPRAVLFDLDDTLHPRRRFLASGFRAAAAHAAAAWSVDERQALAVLARAHRRAPGREFQSLREALALPEASVPELVEVVRGHRPSIRLSDAARAVLAQLRAAWRLGIVTNGLAEVQARKIAALGLPALVDTVVLATAGGRPGKPAPEPFLQACVDLDVAPERSVFVGDDHAADVEGAAAAGLKTIWIAPPSRRGRGSPHADITVHALADVPAAARRLLPSWWSPYAA